jgi:hypothetical protein
VTRDRSLVARLVTGVVAVAVAAGCSGAAAPSSPSATPAEATTSTPAPTGTRSETPAASPATKIPKTFDAKNFAASPTDVNPWLPLTPGLQTVSKGAVNVGTRRLQHIRVNTVTEVTKVIDGVRAVLVLDQDFDGGQLSEQAIDYLAEDEGGNVWYVGSYTEAYEGGVFLNAQDAWLAGVNGAVPGLYMPGDPKRGTPPFPQTSIPGGEQTTAQVVEVGSKTCVPFKCYSDVVVIEEQGSENKHWAPGVGGILTEPLSGDAQETEELINVKELSGKALAELSAEVLRLDRNAASSVPTVFGGSKPAKRGR